MSGPVLTRASTEDETDIPGCIHSYRKTFRTRAFAILFTPANPAQIQGLRALVCVRFAPSCTTLVYHSVLVCPHLPTQFQQSFAPVCPLCPVRFVLPYPTLTQTAGIFAPPHHLRKLAMFSVSAGNAATRRNQPTEQGLDTLTKVRHSRTHRRALRLDWSRHPSGLKRGLVGLPLTRRGARLDRPERVWQSLAQQHGKAARLLKNLSGAGVSTHNRIARRTP